MKKIIKILLIASAIVLNQLALATQIVTNEEAMASQNAVVLSPVDSTPPNPLAPLISVSSPETLDIPVKNPFNIEVIMKAQKDSQLNFSSFKALYGAFRVDITERLLKEAAKTLNGLKLTNLEVPSGKHKIVLRISDNQGRIAEKELIIKVE